MDECIFYSSSQQYFDKIRLSGLIAVIGRKEGRHALNFKQVGFERAALDHEQAARDEIHAAVARATEMSNAEMGEITGARKSSRANLDVSSSYALERDEQCRRRRTGKTREEVFAQRSNGTT